MMGKELKLSKEDILELHTDYDYKNNFIWFAEVLLNLTFDDDSIAESEGKYLYDMCVDILDMNNDRFYPSKNENYAKDIIYKNLLDTCGFNMEYGVSYRQAWFDYYSDNMLIKDRETMDWLLNEFMNEDESGKINE